MADEARVLVVDDDPVTRNLLAEYFAAEDYRVFCAETAEMAGDIVAAEKMDLVLLDIRLPGKDGLTLTRELRVNSEVGIILVSGKQDEIERIVGLECGADEYVTKPFNPREILARAKNLIRRVKRSGSMTAGSARGKEVAFGDWTLHPDRRQLVDASGVEAELTEGEFQLLKAFLRHPGQTMSRDQLLDQIRNREWVPSDRTVDVLVGRLRRKLKDDPASPKVILTVHGAGYRFTPVPRERP
ncbi:response regulator transcription factor [Aromatoleum toluclasticum]|uniref:response regulator transcription factor n=1 Tax=Aromatoleum toluclasticum TaxID=92003 RepID=UPI0003A060D9|nr:response regulator transcription factor [Aromatoleum toluclasticum]